MNKTSRTEYARFGVAEISGSGTVIKQAGGLKYPLVNKPIIESIAKGEAKRVYQQYQDFPDGQCMLGGLVLMNLFANLDRIEIIFSPGVQGQRSGGGLSTTYKFKAVQPFSLEQKVNQDCINYLHRHVSRSSDYNDLGGAK